MVPGMTERERLIADMRRLEWLSDAVIGPARMSYESGLPEIAAVSSSASRSSVWLRRLASTLVFEKRVRIRVRTGSGPA